MILGQFYKGYSRQLFWIVLFGVILWVDKFINPGIMNPNELPMVLYDLLYNLLGGSNYLITILTWFVIMIQSFMIADFTGRNNLLGRTNLLPALIYMILMSHSYQNVVLDQILIGNFFLITYLSLLSRLESDQEDLQLFLNASFLLGLGSMFYLGLSYFIVFGWMSLWALRIFRWREWVISIIGFFIPYLFLIVILYLSDGLNLYIDSYPEHFKFGLMDNFNSIDPIVYVIGGIFLSLVIPSGFKFLMDSRDKKVKIRRASLILLNFFIVALIVVFLSNAKVENSIKMLFVPASVMIAYWFDTMERKWLKELLFSILVIAIIIYKWM